jgi:hypothetical protein
VSSDRQPFEFAALFDHRRDDGTAVGKRWIECGDDAPGGVAERPDALWPSPPASERIPGPRRLHADAPLAIAALLARAALSQMDVPARTSYVMAVVSPAERSAAASVTNVPRSLAAALPPVAAGWMLGHSTFGWPLVIGGALKATYDLLLLRQFRDIRPPEESGARAEPPSAHRT